MTPCHPLPLIAALLAMATAASASDAVRLYSCRSGNGAAQRRVNINRVDGELKATISHGTTANTMATYNPVQQSTCNGGGYCFQGQTKKKTPDKDLGKSRQLQFQFAIRKSGGGLVGTIFKAEWEGLNDSGKYIGNDDGKKLPCQQGEWQD
jgi:hypothetical protein